MHFQDAYGGPVEILLCKWPISSRFYFKKKFDLFFEILSLFSEKNQKVPKSAKRSARNDFALHSKSA